MLFNQKLLFIIIAEYDNIDWLGKLCNFKNFKNME